MMLESLADHHETTGLFLSDVMLASIATAYGRIRKWDEALRCVDEGIALTEVNLERVFAGELWWVRGELLYGKARSAKRAKEAVVRVADEAEGCFRRAVTIARDQEARSLELRSAMSLLRISASLERAPEARESLHAVYASFTEGFDTKDLQDAKTLLTRR
jgi:adenylate cyclase